VLGKPAQGPVSRGFFQPLNNTTSSRRKVLLNPEAFLYAQTKLKSE
jgi:hypothetical protein